MYRMYVLIHIFIFIYSMHSRSKCCCWFLYNATAHLPTSSVFLPLFYTAVAIPIPKNSISVLSSSHRIVWIKIYHPETCSNKIKAKKERWGVIEKKQQKLSIYMDLCGCVLVQYNFFLYSFILNAIVSFFIFLQHRCYCPKQCRAASVDCRAT